jgi:tetratricopeptide (TPR) repeat protein
VVTNPFPGLRPFETDEDHLFFGRERDIDALLARLRSTRFVAVLGASGSGKSSLVRSGLIPSLHSGFMAGAGSSWRVAIMRPGEDPLGQLADALNSPVVLGAEDDFAETRRVLLDATLRRGTLGIVNAVKQSGMPRDHNLLVLVDQFEEIFRFRRSRAAHSRDESIAFVRLLLDAAAQQDVPIYVVLTMRSDFLGDCTDFHGLPDVVNEGIFLVGRMNRDALRSAINGPVAVAGASIAPRLVNRVLNEIGDDQDQLPRVQHALMRTWDHWASRGTPDAAIDLPDYEAVGGLADALSRHAEETWRDAVAAVDAQAVERVFKALTDVHSDPRGVRRPTSVEELAEIGGLTEADVIRIADVFRRPGRSFLMPPARVPLTGASIVDLSHESLMRGWPRLIEWAGQEAEAAELYLRLARAAEWHEAGKAGLWRHPELGIAEQWREDTQPTPAWGRRYDPSFDRAMAFLDASRAAHAAEVAERENVRRATLRRTQWTAAVLAALLIAAAALAIVARRESRRATTNLALARAAVDESLSSVDLDPARLGADVPALEELRRELLMKAQGFYASFSSAAPASAEARHDLALAHLRLGHINRLLRQPGEAEREYSEAIGRFDALVAERPSSIPFRQGLAEAHHWLGETLRPEAARVVEARRAYDRALELQQAIATAQPGDLRLIRQLARTHYDRGILLASSPDGYGAAEADFRAAVALLEPHVPADAASTQELARALNNLAGLLSFDAARAPESVPLYERAIALDEGLVQAAPDHREYRLELAKYYNNLAALLGDLGRPVEAVARSGRAIDLLDSLARLAPSLAVERADSHTLRGGLLVDREPAGAVQEYARALGIFESVLDDPRLRGMPDFHLRFGDLLLDLAAFPGGGAASSEARRLLDRALDRYREVGLALAEGGSLADARTALDNLTAVEPQLPEGLRPRLSESLRRLRQRIDAGR